MSSADASGKYNSVCMCTLPARKMEIVVRQVTLILVGLLLSMAVRADPVGNPAKKGGINLETVVDYAKNETEGQFSGDGWTPPDGLAEATARLVEELTKHGLSSSSPFALLLDPQADVWGGPESRNAVFSFPLSDAETVARAAATAAGQSPVFQKLRDAFTPCAAPDADLSTCVREGVLGLLDRAARAKEMTLLGGAITLRTNGDFEEAGGDEEEEKEDLPEDGRARRDGLDERIARRVVDLAASRVLTLRAPPAALDAVRSGVEEFRGKKGKGLLPLLLTLGLMMKGMMTTLALGTIAMIAGKALAVGLMALTIASVIGLKKLASQGGGGSVEVVKVAASPEHHGRHLASPLQLHLHPYRAHAPAEEVATAAAVASNAR